MARLRGSASRQLKAALRPFKAALRQVATALRWSGTALRRSGAALLRFAGALLWFTGALRRFTGARRCAVLEAFRRDVFKQGFGVVCWVLLLCRVLFLCWALLALGVLPVPIQVGWEAPVLLSVALVVLLWVALSLAGKWVRFRRL
ncbi:MULTISPECIES: hypothetical protein [Actinosynnema]|uniref:hypothetical protein n=1 Tax=Actinosynnema TaxID=40566 RepID=UPI0020A5B4F4|nr:hypothetical protein [Actinosynnema pretiosum]MCP2093748.1 hypothetical protein [Actinosynnema pretiosum]